MIRRASNHLAQAETLKNRIPARSLNSQGAIATAFFLEAAGGNQSSDSRRVKRHGERMIPRPSRFKTVLAELRPAALTSASQHYPEKFFPFLAFPYC